MNNQGNKGFDLKRRRVLIGMLAGSAAGLLQACGGSAGPDAPGQAAAEDRMLATTFSTPSAIPGNQVNLSDFGGVPGASASAVVSAFNQAFARLQSLGGGTLFIASGIYDMGSYGTAANAVNVANLRNVLISGYGAELRLTTTAQVMPVFFNFDNPNNVTIAGLTFRGVNTNLSVNWQGPVCLSVSTSVACSGFKTVDTLADNVVTFLRSYGSYTMTGFDLGGTVSNAYYGVNPNNNGSFSRCDLTCQNVRRGFLAYGAQDWTIVMRCNSTSGALGSNGFIDLIPSGSTEVRNCTVDLTVSGDISKWGALIHFYNQGTSYTRAYNCKANLVLNNVTGNTNAFRFSYEAPNVGYIASSTITAWEQIELTGSVIGSFAGTMVANPSISSATNNSIRVASNLAAYQNMSMLPSYFSVFTPTTTGGTTTGGTTTGGTTTGGTTTGGTTTGGTTTGGTTTGGTTTGGTTTGGTTTGGTTTGGTTTGGTTTGGTTTGGTTTGGTTTGSTQGPGKILKNGRWSR